MDKIINNNNILWQIILCLKIDDIHSLGSTSQLIYKINCLPFDKIDRIYELNKNYILRRFLVINLNAK